MNKPAPSEGLIKEAEETTEDGDGWIYIRQGCELPEVEELCLIVTTEPETRLATMGGHKDTFYEHLHADDWDIRDVQKWKRVRSLAPVEATGSETPITVAELLEEMKDGSHCRYVEHVQDYCACETIKDVLKIMQEERSKLSPPSETKGTK